MPPTTESIILTIFTVLVLGLFIGTNLGVLLMCLMRMASPDPEPEIGYNPPPVRPARRPEVPTGKWRR